MRIISELPLRTRRGVLAAGGAALVGCATLAVISLGVANAQPSAPVPPTLSTPGNAVYVTSDTGPLKGQQDKFISTLASKLGVSSDKLQQALKDTQQEVGPVPLLFGAGVQGATISITSDLSAAARVIGIGADQLKKELAGTSLNDVARAHNIDPQKVAAALKSAREADLNQEVQSGKLPVDVANEVRSNLDAEISMLMGMVRPADGSFGGFNVRIVRTVDPAAGT